ncbi:MAG: hypothetical protein AB1384_12160 [Actinomycetota bacterium]
MLKKESAEVSGKGLVRKAVPLLLLGMAALLALQFAQLDESKKRFIVHLAKQAPYLPGRYYA